MNVLVAAVTASVDLSGVQRHAFSLASCLLRLSDIARVDLAVAPWQDHTAVRHVSARSARLRFHHPAIRNTPLSRNRWFYAALPSLAREIGADIVHVSHPVPLHRAAFQCPLVLSMHDLYPYDSPGNFGLLKAQANRTILQQCVRAADAITCVSDATLSALRQHVPPDVYRKATRIYNVVDVSATVPSKPNEVSIEEPFLLCVAQHRHNKNIPLAIRSFRRLLQRDLVAPSTTLLIIGNNGPETPHLQRLVEELGLSTRVQFVHGLSDESLFWCYQHTLALLMPSLVEGFGLPAVEAAQAGCKVVCSDIPALREVCGDYCTYVQPDDDAVGTFSDAVLTSLAEPRRSAVSHPQFLPRRIAEEFSQLYQQLLVGSAGAPATFEAPAVPSASYRSLL